MVPESASLKNKHKATVHVLTEGGRGTSALFGRSQISDKGLKLAIIKSIQKYGLFSSVVKVGESDYTLQVKLLGLDQPLAGINMEVRMSTHWTLSDREGNKVWENFIASTYKANFGEALIGTTRLAKANEGAARQSIKEGIEEISNLKLDGKN